SSTGNVSTILPPSIKATGSALAPLILFFLRNVAIAATQHQAEVLRATPSIARVDRRRRISSRTVGERSRLAAIGASGPLDYWLVKRKITIGSDPQNDLILSDGTVSKKHAILKRRFQKF